MGSKKKWILRTLIFIVVSAAGTGYYLYNKTGINIQSEEGKKVSATDLYATFIKDSVSAKKDYTNQVLEVSGVVTLVSENQQHQRIVMLKTTTSGAAVNCTLEGPSGNIKPGDNIIIKGICGGIGEGDADLGMMGDVYLVRCYISK